MKIRWHHFLLSWIFFMLLLACRLQAFLIFLLLFSGIQGLHSLSEADLDPGYVVGRTKITRKRVPPRQILARSPTARRPCLDEIEEKVSSCSTKLFEELPKSSDAPLPPIVFQVVAVSVIRAVPRSPKPLLNSRSCTGSYWTMVFVKWKGESQYYRDVKDNNWPAVSQICVH